MPIAVFVAVAVARCANLRRLAGQRRNIRAAANAIDHVSPFAQVIEQHIRDAGRAAGRYENYVEIGLCAEQIQK